MKIHYNNSLEEHHKTHKMIKAIFWLYYFSHMQRKVVNYVSKCDLCHKIKLSRHKSYKEIRIALILNWLWTLIVMNFIIKLSSLKKLLTEVIYNSILIIVDQLIKKARFVLYLEALNAEELVYIFLRNVTAFNKLSEEIISDKDKLFTFNFWTSLIRQLEIKHKLLTVYHLQTDKQTEQMNQVIE